MKKSIFSTKTIVAIGIGTALFVILGRFASIPTGIPNTSIETNYALLALISTIFGPIAGLFIGLIGHALKDAISYGSVWWSWVIVSAFIGLGIGLFRKMFSIQDGEFGRKKIIAFNIAQSSVQAIGWFIIAPILDILIYAEPANKVFTQGIIAGISNIITVGILGTFLLAAYAKTRTKKGSLSYED
ncbi:ECF-type riboflavin transporter substrate-binding protein [Sporosarcina sp. ANT_H38]|uniref:ECF-type riboflavin transporter substrate-binding protein n=1 Tax=Sporosarcina sp. ANT_H38 TaxID=2597358 RepID=UPI0011F108E2|nr:ECF-type riboflavin transporter substrate-binding protein [Sporosarcina sp. ANT_H38]KAA0965062.1 ECF-type riboflavin transporter substrate-binding protein [Sporosarcina sp. ANT_H38]